MRKIIYWFGFGQCFAALRLVRTQTKERSSEKIEFDVFNIITAGFASIMYSSDDENDSLNPIRMFIPTGRNDSPLEYCLDFFLDLSNNFIWDGDKIPPNSMHTIHKWTLFTPHKKQCAVTEYNARMNEFNYKTESKFLKISPMINNTDYFISDESPHMKFMYWLVDQLENNKDKFFQTNWPDIPGAELRDDWDRPGEKWHEWSLFLRKYEIPIEGGGFRYEDPVYFLNKLDLHNRHKLYARFLAKNK